MTFFVMNTVKELAIGAEAPDFELKNQLGKSVRLSDFRGKYLVLYFYPADDTPGCTLEACNLRDNFSVIVRRNTAILGVSPDDAGSHQRFMSKYRLPFDLLCDPEHKVLELYGAWGEKIRNGETQIGVLRTSYVIDDAGKIRGIVRDVNTEEHTGQLLPFLPE